MLRALPSGDLSPEVTAAIEDAERVTLCPRCQTQRGLCASCALNDPGILPQLAKPPWVRLAGTQKKPTPAMRVDVLPPINTPGRKAARRLLRHLGGQFTRSPSLAQV